MGELHRIFCLYASWGMLRLHSLMLGEAFISVAEDTATEYCEKRQEVLTDRLESMKETRDNIVKRQAELKKYLYGKFGNNINLDK